MEFYRESPQRYNFLQFDAIFGHLRRTGCGLVASYRGNHEPAERCPKVLPRKRVDLGAAYAA